LGKASEVAQLAACSDKDFEIGENIPYAEVSWTNCLFNFL